MITLLLFLMLVLLIATFWGLEMYEWHLVEKWSTDSDEEEEE